jgi:pyrroloquinoline quinone (PQQ) biosynthesis protein C
VLAPLELPRRDAEEFAGSLRALVVRHPIDPALAHALKYGEAPAAGLRRWAKDFYHYVKDDAQGTAAMLARCRDRALFLHLSAALGRKAGFYQTGDMLGLYRRFTRALGIDDAELEAHWACAETYGGLFTKRALQHEGFEEGWAASYLCSEGALRRVLADEAPLLCQRGIAEYMQRAYALAADAVAFWRTWEDFDGLEGADAWDLLPRIAWDASLQARVRCAFAHALSVYACMRRAWSALVMERYREPTFVWPRRRAT